MARAVTADMRDRAIDPVDDPGGDDHVQKLAAEIIGVGRHGSGDLKQIALGPHLDTGSDHFRSCYRSALWRTD